MVASGILTIPLLAFRWLLLLSTAEAFGIQPATTTLQRSCLVPLNHRAQAVIRFAATSDDDNDDTTTSKRKKRVRRKTETEIEEAETAAAVVETMTPPPVVPQEQLQPRKESAVPMQVMDVRDLVSGNSQPMPQTTTKKVSSSRFINDEDDDFVDSNDPLARLLVDAKQMRAMEEDSDAKEGGVTATIKKVLSTIVTFDFFVVCALFLWFLAGIFCSYILKDDTVQIAFNGIFQPVVQPALGLLMIASISDAVLKGDEEG